MKTIKNISSKSLAKLLGLMYLIMGFIFGLIMLAISLISYAAEGEGTWIVLGIAALVLFPLLYGIIGWIGGYIVGLFYNFLAKRVGGIQVEVE